MINELITGNTPSTAANPTVDITEVVIESHGAGKIELQMQVTGGNWATIVTEKLIFPLVTTDVAISYRFLPTGLTKSVRVYFGP